LKTTPLLLALSPLALALSMAHAGAAQRGEQSAPSGTVTTGRVYKFERIADGVYYATSAGTMATGSNNVVVVGDDSLLVVDTGTSPAAARAMIEDVRLISTKPVKYVVDTHFHYDHVNGNQVYAGKAEIIGHDYVKYAIEKLDVLHREPYLTSQLTNVPSRIAALKQQIAETQDAARRATLERQLATAEQGWEALKEVKPTAPTRTYSKRLDLKVGTHEVQLLFLGRGHTNGDTVVYLPKEKVYLPKEKIVCTGDLMESGIAYMGDAQFDEWVKTLDALKGLDWQTELPGHGAPFHDKALVTAFQSYLTDVVRQGTELKKQGMSAEEAAQRIDLTSHQKDFPAIRQPGADLRGVRRLYAWLDERSSNRGK
jgi:cyclase